MDGNDSPVTVKRQRPLSDTEDNVPLSSDGLDGKRRRLEVSGQENCLPQPSSSSSSSARGRSRELEVKADTPAPVSVRSRVQQLTQRRGGLPPLAQRCLSDPGHQDPPVLLPQVPREHLIGEEEFSQRVERFNTAPGLQPSPLPSPANPGPLNLSSLVTDIHLKLQGSVTPSSKQASRIRQEREAELRLVRAQPITDNVWLKRSCSDSSLAEADCEPSPLTNSSFSDKPVATAPLTNSSFSDKPAATAPPGGEDDSQLDHTELSSHEEINTAEMIDQMFDEVLEMAAAGGRGLEEGEEHDSGIAAVAGEKEKTGVECDKEKNEGTEEEEEEIKKEEEEIGDVDELLTFPPSGILSPLSKSVEAVVTPLRLAASQQAPPTFQPLTPQELTTPSADSAPLYSVDAYRTQRQSAQPAFQSVTPGIQRRAPEKPRPQATVNTKERIKALNEEAGKLQTVIGQTLQALGCCTDEEHGRGSLEEAEAEKLLLVSSEKRASLLAEVARLRETGLEGPEAGGRDLDSITQQPCRGTVSISSVQLPLKVEFLCSARNRTGRPSHYFFVLIRYGPCNIVATPLATAADALNGDTISFPISITLQDIRSSFEIDVEVYSLTHTSGNTCHKERSATKSRVTPRKLLNTLTQRSNHTVTSSSAPPALSARRSSNFSLVGSHKITLASLGQSKFPLDKMKFEGKIRRLLGDEFQEKVPFLSPLEGSVYLRLDSQGHSSVQHHGFLTMFEVVKGFGAWHRRFLVLEGGQLSYWNHPNDQANKPAEGSISLSSSSSQTVKPVKRDSCARPFTFELVSNVQTQQEGDAGTPSKCWFSADTREERADWMDKLNQVLLDIHTWSHTTSRAKQPSGPANLRESIL